MYFLLNQFIGLFLIIFIQLPSLTQSVQCIDNCVIHLPINTIISSFNQSSINETFCRVDLTFNFSHNSVMIHFKPSEVWPEEESETYGVSENNSSHGLIAKFNLASTGALTTVIYFCTTDDCDQLFVNETLKKMVHFNTIDLQKYLFNSFYTSTPNSSKIECAGKTCGKDQFCKAGIAYQISNIEEYVFTTMHRNCVNKTVAEHNLISFRQIWTEGRIHNSLHVLCNRPYCDRKRFLYDTLSCVIKQFQLPLDKTFVTVSNKTMMIPSLSKGLNKGECVVVNNTKINKHNHKKSDATNLSVFKFYFILSIFFLRYDI